MGNTSTVWSSCNQPTEWSHLLPIGILVGNYKHSCEIGIYVVRNPGVINCLNLSNFLRTTAKATQSKYILKDLLSFDKTAHCQYPHRYLHPSATVVYHALLVNSLSSGKEARTHAYSKTKCTCRGNMLGNRLNDHKGSKECGTAFGIILRCS